MLGARVNMDKVGELRSTLVSGDEILIDTNRDIRAGPV